MRKKAESLKVGDKIIVEGEEFTVSKFEKSEIGKHGKRKCRIETKEGKVFVRPSDFEVELS